MSQHSIAYTGGYVADAPPRRRQPDPQSALYMGHNFEPGWHTRFAIKTLRGYFAAEPPELQRATLARVKRLVAEHPQSYLAKHWRAIYGVTP